MNQLGLLQLSCAAVQATTHPSTRNWEKLLSVEKVCIRHFLSHTIMYHALCNVLVHVYKILCLYGCGLVCQVVALCLVDGVVESAFGQVVQVIQAQALALERYYFSLFPVC